MHQDNLKVKGRVKYTITKPDGQKFVFEKDNLVMDKGQENFAKRIAGVTATPMSHIAVGASSAAAAKTQTALQGTEHERVAATITVIDNKTVAVDASFGTGIATDVTIGEFGIFNASSGGDMLCRFICNEFEFDAADELDIAWRLTIGD